MRAAIGVAAAYDGPAPSSFALDAADRSAGVSGDSYYGRCSSSLASSVVGAEVLPA